MRNITAENQIIDADYLQHLSILQWREIERIRRSNNKKIDDIIVCE